MGFEHVSFGISILLGIGGFWFKREVDELRKLKEVAQDLRVQNALHEEALRDHKARIGSFETVVPELKVALVALQTDMRRLVAWVDAQERHRRSTDSKD